MWFNFDVARRSHLPVGALHAPVVLTVRVLFNGAKRERELAG